jgi:hypothetical protein
VNPRLGMRFFLTSSPSNYSKGSIKKAAKTAIKKWIMEESTMAVQDDIQKRGDPVDLISGDLVNLWRQKRICRDSA